MKIKKIINLFPALVLGLSTLLSLGFGGVVHATSGDTWTGSSSSTSGSGGCTANCWSVAGNWSSGVPTTGTNIIFDNTNLTARTTTTNDISGLSIGSITFQGTNTSYYGFNITGDTLTITGGITQSANAYSEIDMNLTLGADQTFNDTTNNLYIGDSTQTTSYTLALGTYNLTLEDSTSCTGIYFYSILTGSGSLIDDNSVVTSLYAASPSYTGSVIVNNGTLYIDNNQSLGSGTSGVTVAAAATLDLGLSANTTFSNPLTILGSGVNNSGAITTSTMPPGACKGGGGGMNSYVATWAGSITLQGNTTVDPSPYNIVITGPLSGSYTLTVVSGATGTLTINSSNNTSQTSNSSQTAPAQTITVAAGDNQPNLAVDIGNNQTYIIDGIRGSTTVSPGGLLKGTGTVGDLYIESAASSLPAGIVSPGDAPGCITISGNLSEAGTYQEEIGGTTPCSGFDQLIVTGTITLDDGQNPPTQGILQVSLINGFAPKAGQTFEIINNQGGKAITDTFAGLPEGSTITVSGYVFKISYVGGTTGNNVVLTVVSVPKAPNTGFGLISNSLMNILSLIGAIIAVSGLSILSRRMYLKNLR